MSVQRVEKTNEEWKALLDDKSYKVIRGKGTEAPGSGEYDHFYPEEGHFICKACSTPLYSAKSKFDSGCGWPAFDKCFKGALKLEVDDSLWMRRIEIMCGACDGHLGHVFEGESFTNTNERHCVNSVSVVYVEGAHSAEEEAVVANANLDPFVEKDED